MTSVLLGEPTGLCMTRGRVVWFVCSGWGPFAVVHRASGWRESVSSLRTAVSTADRVTGGVAEIEVFLEVRPDISAWSAGGSAW
jgi:hypothetical protein